MRGGRIFVLLLIASLAVPASAAQIKRLDVSRDGERYRVEMDVQLDAAARRAYEVFADPQQLPLINPAIRVVQVLVEPGAERRLYTEVHLCVALLCHTLHQVQDMSGAGDAQGGRLLADVLPARSDLRYGHAEWRFSGNAQSTDLHLQLEVEPGFWVPPLIGPWFVERLLREQAIVTSVGIEKQAAI